MAESLNERAKRIFMEAVDLPPAERDGYVAGACGGDGALRDRVGALMAADADAAGAFLESPTIHRGREDDVTASLGTLTITTTDGRGARELEVPERVGPIVIGREIGHGATGVVFRGRDEMLGRDVAVKFLRFVPQAGGEGADIEAFCEGVRRACRLTHQGLTAIYAANVHEGVPYIVMEYIDGPSLREVSRRRGALDIRAVIPMARRMCEAVGALHDAGIVHRDIKPGNVMLTLDGRVVVTDFGLACDRPWGTINERMERVAGTPAYMAPEMFEGAVSTRTDVFALGVTIYELLTGRLPFGDSFSSIRETLEAEEPEIDLSEVPEDLAEILRRATRKNPLYRFKNARRMYEALAALPAQDFSGLNLVGLVDVSREQLLELRQQEGDSTPCYYETISKLAERKKVREPEVVAGSGGTEPEGMGSGAAAYPCRRCGAELLQVSASGHCRSCGLPYCESVAPGLLVSVGAACLSRMQRLVVVSRGTTALLPYALWCAALGGTAATVGAWASVAMLGVQALVTAVMLCECVRSPRESLLLMGAGVASFLHLLTVVAIVVAAFVLGPASGVARPIVAGLGFTLVLCGFLMTGVVMGLLRSLDRHSVLSRKPGYEVWLLVLGLPGPILLGFEASMLLDRSVTDHELSGLMVLVTLMVTTVTVSAWLFAAWALAGAQRTLAGFAGVSRRRAGVMASGSGV